MGATLHDLSEGDSRREQELKDLRDELATLASSQEQRQADSIATLEAALADLDRRLTALEQSGSSERQSIQSLQSELADLRASSAAAEERSRAQELAIADLSLRSSARHEASPLDAASADQEPLLRLEKRLRQNDGQLSLVCDDRNITKIFEITGLDRVFTIHATREEAVGAGSTA